MLYICHIMAPILAQTAYAANEVTIVTVDNIEYTLYDDHTAAVTNGNSAVVTVELPSSITYDSNTLSPTYKAALPSEGTSGNGVRITLGTKSVELMNPDKVEFFKVEAGE